LLFLLNSKPTVHFLNLLCEFGVEDIKILAVFFIKTNERVFNSVVKLGDFTQNDLRSLQDCLDFFLGRHRVKEVHVC
jgi:hypothetical protein